MHRYVPTCSLARGVLSFEVITRSMDTNIYTIMIYYHYFHTTGGIENAILHDQQFNTEPLGNINSRFRAGCSGYR